MKINIRREEPTDYRKVEEITREAFWNLYCPGCLEHFLANQIRKHEEFIPELTFVIEVDGEVVGSIFYTYCKIVKKNGEEVQAISFGPVSIAPKLHRQGLGRKLITYSIEEAKRLGHRAIILGGFRYHYEPYGFEGVKKYGIYMVDGKFYTGIMALPLYEGALDNCEGVVHFSEALAPDETKLEAYDSTFPPREKLVLPCQKDFEKASTEIDQREF